MKRLTSNIEGLSARQLAQRCIGAEELSNGRERKLALGDDILMSVSSPARYVGGEVNSVMKTLTPGMVRFAMCFPDVYEIGMSHLGIQILYDMFNRYDDVWCERVYSPWLDLDKIMREKKIPLFALESQEPVKNFDFLGITLQYEMCYTNVLQVLDLSGIPLLAKDRTEEDPIVIGGGPCSYNPEPIAEFFDLFYIGEGETAYRKLLDVYKEVKEKVSEIVPDYMIPEYVKYFYDIPLSSNGKIDRKKIAQDFSIEKELTEDDMMKTQTEETVSAIWSEVLGLDSISRNSGFIEIGGDSLAATKFLTIIKNRMGVDISLQQMFENQTLYKIAELIEQKVEESDMEEGEI